MSLRLSGLNPSSYLGVEPLQPPNFTPVNRAPTVKDYQAFNIGSLWLNTLPTTRTASDVYMLVNKAAGIATWVNFAGGSSLLTLTGNTGGAVAGDGADNINIVGDGVTITVAGNPGTHTLTASVISGTGVLTALQPDIGLVVHPIGGVINIHNTDTNVVTSNGGTNNLDINLANNLNIVGSVTAGGQFLSTLVSGNNFFGDGSGAMGLQNNAVSSTGPTIGFLKTRALAVADNGDETGSISFAALNTSLNNEETAIITSEITAAPGAGFLSGNLQFWTSNASTGSSVRYTIDQNGVNTISAAAASATTLVVNGGISSITTYGTTVGGTNSAVLIDNTGLMGTISSSLKYKENVHDMSTDSTPILDLRPVKFNYKSDSTKSKQWGLIAEEVMQILPGLVNLDDEYDPESVRYHDLPVLLLNELQKLHKRVQLLEEQITSINDR